MEKRRAQKRSDNRGAALLMVIIVLSFIAVLGLTVQAASLINRQMKNVDQASKKNFYSAEAALEEIKTNLETRMTVCADYAYQDILKNYSKFTALYYSTIQLQEYFRKQVIQYMCILDKDNMAAGGTGAGNGYLANYTLSGPFTVSSSQNQKENIREMLYGYTENAGSVKINSAYVSDKLETYAYAPDFSADGSEYRSVTFHNISVEYIENGYATTITTDIKIKIPDIVIDPVNYAKSTVFLDYIFITDGTLSFTSNLNGDVKGNVYAYNGLTVEEAKKLDIRADKFISGGDVELASGSNLLIKELITKNAAIWAKGFETVRSLASEPAVTTLTLNGTVNVADDLTLSAGNSRVTVNGAFYGFGSGNATDTSSAVAVNGSGSRLALNVSELLLAGRNYISFSKIASGDSDKNDDYLTGEALALKSGQLAYLVPEQYIKVGHNPVLGSEYQKNSDMIAIGELANDLKEYVNQKNPYQTVFYHSYATQMVYYYLNFKDAEAAKKYFIDYIQEEANLQEMEEVFASEGITISKGCHILTDSNVVTYNTDAQGIHLEVSSIGAAQETAEKAQEKQKSYGYMLNTLGYILPEGERQPDSVFNWLTVADKLKDLELSGYRYIHVINESGHGAVAANGDISTDRVAVGSDGIKDRYQQIKSGVIVSGGTVTVANDFTGLIVAKEGIVVEGGANYAANSVIAGNIIENAGEYKAEWTDISMADIFNTDVLKLQLGSSENGKSMYVDMKDLVSFENWSKN